MTVEPVNSLNRASEPARIKESFLKLLTVQLKNQDPINPMDNQELTAQLARLSQTESLENIKNYQSSILNLQTASLVGKNVKALREDGSLLSGTVSKADYFSESPAFYVEGEKVYLSQLREISQ